MKEFDDKVVRINDAGLVQEVTDNGVENIYCPMSFSADNSAFCTGRCAWCSLQELTNDVTNDSRMAVLCKEHVIGFLSDVGD